jgi:diguanylate cyclase (GGDEF)-like protein
MRIKGDDTPIAPGEWRDADVASGVLRDNLLPLPYKEPSQTLMTLLNQIVEEGRRFANAADLTLSDMSAQAPVGTTLAILERTLKNMSAIQARVHYSMKQELGLLKKIIADYTPEDYDYQPSEGSRKAKRSDYDDVDVIPVSDPNASTMALSRHLTRRLEAARAMAEAEALTDPLTGLRNRRFAMQEMPKEAALALRRLQARRPGDSGQGADLVLFMIDFDHFKTVNDRFGHAAGDAVLCQFAERLRAVFRASDHIIRWGGEEFLVVARDTDREGAAELAERIRSLMESRPFQLEDGQRVLRTVCVGFAPYPLSTAQPDDADWEQVVDLADHLFHQCAALVNLGHHTVRPVPVIGRDRRRCPSRRTSPDRGILQHHRPPIARLASHAHAHNHNPAFIRCDLA